MSRAHRRAILDRVDTWKLAQEVAWTCPLCLARTDRKCRECTHCENTARMIEADQSAEMDACNR